MSTTTPTIEEMEKASNLGFATHLIASGVPADKVKEVLPKFAAQKKARAARTRHICASILGKDSKLFAEAK